MKRGAPLKRLTPLRSTVPLKAGKALTQRRENPAARGTGLAPGGPLERSARLRPVSTKRQQENRERRAMVAALFPDHQAWRPLCAVWEARQTIGLPPLPDCTRWADDCHEPLSRARGGSIMDPANASAPCRPCHDVLGSPESELGWARKLGLIKGAKWGGGEVPGVA